ncbi:uncharacterized protein LOC132053955 [Lycium ferocissimum]|uniref:uncharacterized protein LOC132053955 n=1 Tax=Lycium ferocissimum TaxID=112874 RepID=UPI00281573A6|nr:uncharacterized protein LOC132053955 [Lycium ferocissimum]
MATAETKLSMKLLIDTKAKKVLFAEVEKDFFDFLFHILSLPVGTVIKLLKERGMNGCLPNLYESVENMNDTYIQSSKDIILKPECPFRISSLPLQLLNDVPTQRAVYKCSSLYSSVCINVSDDPSAICAVQLVTPIFQKG